MAEQEVNNDKGTVRLEKTSLPNHISNLCNWNQLEALNFSICNVICNDNAMRDEEHISLSLSDKQFDILYVLTLIYWNKVFREFQIITKQHITFETVLIYIHV